MDIEGAPFFVDAHIAIVCVHHVKSRVPLALPQILRLLFAFMAAEHRPARRLISAVQVLAILAMRLEKRADVLERVNLRDFDMAVLELRKFAGMLRRLAEYLRAQHGPS